MVISGMKNDAKKVVFVKSLFGDKVRIGMESLRLMGDVKYLCA